MLFGMCGPAAVFRRVRTIVVGETVDGMFRTWPTPHVGEEINKAIVTTPTVTDDDPTAAVVVEISDVLVVAAALYVGPNSIFRSLRSVGFIP